MALCSVCPGKARQWAASRVKRTRARRWSIGQKIPLHPTPTPPLPLLMSATTVQTRPSCSRISLPPPRQARELLTSTTPSRHLAAPLLLWLRLGGQRPPSPVPCPTPSLVLSQVSGVSVSTEATRNIQNKFQPSWLFLTTCAVGLLVLISQAAIHNLRASISLTLYARKC